MRIAHIITRLILGGAQENTLITCKLLAQRGHKVTLITGPAIGPEGALFEQTRGQGYEIIEFDRLIRPIRPLNDAIAYAQLKRLLGRLAPEVVHTHSAKAGILGRYAAAALQPRPAIIHTIHGLAFHPYLPRRTNRLYIAIEKAAARKTDAFVSVADAMTEQMHAAGIGTDKPFTTAYSAIEERSFLDAPDVERIKGFRRL